MTLPSLREVTRQLRALHEAWAHPDGGGEYATLARLYDPDTLGYKWQVQAVSLGDEVQGYEHGHEYVPGDGRQFDAVAAARRLLAAARGVTA